MLSLYGAWQVFICIDQQKQLRLIIHNFSAPGILCHIINTYTSGFTRVHTKIATTFQELFNPDTVDVLQQIATWTRIN